MRAFQRVVLIGLVWISIQLVSSCGEGPCPSDSYNVTAEITGVEFGANQIDEVDHGGATHKAVQLVVDLRQNELDRQMVQNQTRSFGSVAYALDCIGDDFSVTYLNYIDSVVITSDKPYNQVAGTDILSLMDEGFSDDLKSRTFRTTGYIADKNSFYTSFITPPAVSDTFTFTIQVFDRFGALFTATTEPFFISAE